MIEIVLFSEDTYHVPLSGPAIVQQTAWIVDTQTGSYERMGYEYFLWRTAHDVIRQKASK
jgi:hypothetical protein